MSSASADRARWPATGADSRRALLGRQAATGAHFQARQSSVAFSAGRGWAYGRAQGCRAETILRAGAAPALDRCGQGRRGAQAPRCGSTGCCASRSIMRSSGLVRMQASPCHSVVERPDRPLEWAACLSVQSREIEVGIMTARDGGRIHGWWNQFHPVIQKNGHGVHTFFFYGTKLEKELRSSFPTQVWGGERRRQGSR